MDFYDGIAGEYDEITGSAERSAKAEGFVKELQARYPVKSALDAACGTGVYTIPLARMGVRTVGSDISAAMLAQARRRAEEAGAPVEWVCSPMQELTAHVRERFDAVLCMGNSFPHLLADADRDTALDAFRELLNPGGVLVLQLLNYARILARQERIVGIDRHGERQYVRFYDFLPRQVRFNILTIAWQGRQCRHELHSTLLRPYTAKEMHDALARRGLREIELYAGLGFAPFDEERSETVMLIAREKGSGTFSI